MSLKTPWPVSAGRCCLLRCVMAGGAHPEAAMRTAARSMAALTVATDAATPPLDIGPTFGRDYGGADYAPRV